MCLTFQGILRIAMRRAILLLVLSSAACSTDATLGVRRYQLTGVVVGREASPPRVVVAHDAVEGLMPAMSMAFEMRGPHRAGAGRRSDRGHPRRDRQQELARGRDGQGASRRGRDAPAGGEPRDAGSRCARSAAGRSGRRADDAARRRPDASASSPLSIRGARCPISAR